MLMFKNSWQQMLYNVIFSGACAGLGSLVISAMNSDVVCWKVFIGIFVVVFFLVGLTNSAIQYIFGINNDEEDNDDFISEPMYIYHDYCNGFAIVECVMYNTKTGNVVETLFSFVDKKGDMITNKWYNGVTDFNEYNVAIVYDGFKYNIIDTEGRELSNEWFDVMKEFSDGVAKVGRTEDGAVNFIDTTGKLLWENWRKELQ